MPTSVLWLMVSTSRRVLARIAVVVVLLAALPGVAAAESRWGGTVVVGVSAKSVGVLEITDDDPRFVEFVDRKRLAAAAVVGLLLARRPRS